MRVYVAQNSACILKYQTTSQPIQLLYNYIPIWTWYHVVTYLHVIIKRLNEDLCCAITIFNPYQTHHS